jgi:hypothetical protein
MWKTKIAEKKFDRGVLRVIVSFDNGVENFTEVYNVTNNQSLDSNIKGKLQQLADVDKLDAELSVGEFKPIVVSEVSIETPIIKDIM